MRLCAQAHFSKQLDQLLDNITAKQREYDQVKADLDACLAESGRVSQALATADRKLQVGVPASGASDMSWNGLSSR